MSGLKSIPFYGGWLERGEQHDREDVAKFQQAQGLMQILGQLQQQGQRQQALARQNALREQLTSSGGDPEKAMKAALAAGDHEAAAKLAPLVKIAQEGRQRDETAKGFTEMNAQPQGGKPWEQMNPSERRTQRIGYLNRLAQVYANNPTVMQRIQGEIDKLSSVKPMVEHNFSVGDNMVQPHISHDEGVTWQPVPGSKPSAKFAKQIPPSVTVTTPKPDKAPAGYRFTPNGDLEPIPGGPADPEAKKTPARALPTAAAQKLFENQTNLRRAETALALMEGKDVGQMKGDAGATGWKGFVPDTVLQRLDPKGVDARAAIADLGSLVIHERSVAAVTAAEFPRLKPFIPTPTDDPETVKKKLRRFAQIYRDVASETANFYSESGYKVPELVGLESNTPKAPSGPATPSKRIKFDAQGNPIP